MNPIQNSHFSPASSASSGFTTLEILGIVAIFAILAAAVAPTAIRTIDRKYSQAEQESLQSMADGLIESIQENHRIPGPDDWAETIATEIESSPGKVLQNSRGNERRFLIDPDFWDAGDDTLPYTQDWEGVESPPNSPRLMIVSSIHHPLPSDPIPFNDLWHAEDGKLPSGEPWTSWSGEADDVNLERIHLGSLFHRLLLHNVDGSVNAEFEIHGDRNTASSTPWEAYFLKGTPVGLYDLEASPQEVIRLLLKDDTAYYFAQSLWQSRFTFGGQNEWLDDLAAQLRQWIEDGGFEMNDLNLDMKEKHFQIMGPGANPGS